MSVITENDNINFKWTSEKLNNLKITNDIKSNDQTVQRYLPRSLARS